MKNKALKATLMTLALSGAFLTRDGAPAGLAERMARQLKQLQDNGPLQRSAEVASFDVERRTVNLAFSSETEYERWFGIEVLGHEPGEIVLDRMQDGAAVLVNHDWDDQVGIVESVEIGADRRGRAVVRFGKSARANEIFQDIVDGIRKHVSVGYSVQDWVLAGERDGVEIYRMTKWTPFEISIVAVPADTTVGVGRSMEKPHEEPGAQKPDTAGNRNENEIISESRTLKGTEKMYRFYTDAAGNKMRVAVNAEGQDAGAPEMVESGSNARQLGQDAERARVRAISDLADKFATMPGANTADLARAAIAGDVTVEAFQRQILDAVNARQAKPLNEQAQGNDIGLTENESRSFSFLKVIRALSDPTDRRAQAAAAFEFDVSQAAAKASGKSGERFMVPTDVLRRALNTGTSGGASTGGYGIQNNLLVSSFVDILRNKTVLMRRGNVLSGLTGNIDIPRQIAAATGYWLGEDDDAAESNLELGQISMTPHTVAAYSEITRKLLQQSSLDVEAMVRADLAKALGLTLDLAGFYGKGTDHQPLGIFNHTGVSAVDFGATQPTYAEIVDMETQVALDNADVDGMVYCGNAAWRGAMKTTQKFAGTNGAPVWELGNTVNGYATEVTNQLVTGDVGFCNFNDVVVGLWGGLELAVDPFTGSKKGRLRVVAFQDADVALRRVESVCVGRN